MARQPTILRRKLVRDSAAQPMTSIAEATGPVKGGSPALAPATRAHEASRQRIMFASTVHYLPELTGGIESTTHEMCHALMARGCEVAVFSRTRRMSRFAWKARFNRSIGRAALARDRTLGYPVYRTRTPLAAVDAACKAFAPTLAVVQSGAIVPLAREFASRGVPTVVFLHNLTYSQMGGDFFSHPRVSYATVSEFMASALKEKLGIAPIVIAPLIVPERYATATSRDVATFVNPTPIKGLEIALHLARRRPDIQFEFVESWPLRRRERQSLTQALADLPNVRFQPRVSDMRAVYARSRVLLAPSQWREPWGRVVAEAQLNGIPVVASNTGGLPEVVGDGGLLVTPHDDPAAWEAALAQAWDDSATYERLSYAALEHSRRPDIQPDRIVSAFLALAVMKTASLDRP
jgi:glycosyltransferase involved in cell wall biosynthesis